MRALRLGRQCATIIEVAVLLLFGENTILHQRVEDRGAIVTAQGGRERSIVALVIEPRADRPDGVRRQAATVRNSALFGRQFARGRLVEICYGLLGVNVARDLTHQHPAA